MIPRLLVFGAGVGMALMVYSALVSKGVEKERARVEHKGEAIVKKVKKAQRDNAAKPVDSVLSKWAVD